MNKFFRVVSVSSKSNSFGLHGHILVARDGAAWEVARNRGPHLTEWNKGSDVSIPLDIAHDPEEPLWGHASCEIPRRLPNCPPNVLTEIYS